MAQYDGIIKIFTRVDTSGVERGARDIETRMDSVKNKIQKIGTAIAGVFAVKALIKFGKEAIELGSNLEEVQNVVDNVFRTMSNDVDEFAKKAASAYGLSETMAKKFTGTFGAMAKAFGFSEKEAYDMSTTLTGLAGDVASFYNIDQEAAYAKLKSVFSGETESLKDLGIVMTQTALDSYAMQQGIGKTTAKMTEQEKVALRYRFILDQLSTASGDFTRTSGGWANQVRILKLQFDSLKATIGQGLINVLTPVLKVINALLAKLATLANAFKSFTELITGKKSSGQTSASGAGIADMGDVATGYDNAADSASNLADATGDVADATSAAAKEQDKYLSGLDEMRKLEPKDAPAAGSPGKSGAGSGSGVGIGSGSGVSTIDYGELAKGDNELEKTNTVLDKLIAKFKELKDIFIDGFWDGLGNYKDSFEKIDTAISSIKQSLKSIFTDPEVINSANNYINSVVFAMGQITGSFLSVGLSIATNLISGAAQYLDESKEYIKDRLVSMFDAKTAMNYLVGDFYEALANIWSVITGENGTGITKAIIGIFSDAALGIGDLFLSLSADLTEMFTAPFIDNQEKFKEAIDNFFGPVRTVLETLHESVKATVQKAKGVYDNKVKPLLDSVTNGISMIVGKVLDAWNQYIAPVLDRLSEKFKTVWEEHIQPVFDTAWDVLGKACAFIQVLWEQYLLPFFSWLIDTFAPPISEAIALAGQLILGLLATVGDVAGGILESLGGVLDFLTGIFSGDWNMAMEGLKTAVRGVRNAVKSVFGYIRNTILKPLDEWLTGIFATDWSETYGALGDVVNAFFDVVEPIYTELKNTLGRIIMFLKNIFQGNWEDVWNAVSKVFSDVWSGLEAIAKAPINAIIAMINSLINMFNNAMALLESALELHFSIPNPFGGTLWSLDWKATLPRINYEIPPLAQGAVIPPNAPFLAMLGDQTKGNNIEAPEDLIRKIVREESGGRDRNYTFVAQLNGKTLFRQMVTEAELRQMQTGRNPFELA